MQTVVVKEAPRRPRPDLFYDQSLPEMIVAGLALLVLAIPLALFGAVFFIFNIGDD